MTNAASVSKSAEEKAEETLSRLRAYVGPNWDSHYEMVFRHMFARQQQGRSIGWTWNWPAALMPLWFLYRRLYAGFFAYFAVYIVIDGTDKMVAGSPDGGSAVAILFLGLVVLAGFLGDRLLFSKALEVVSRERKATAEELEALGRPNRWAVWVLPAIILLGVVSTILIPIMAGA